ncbi:DNA-binding GntR family transcriptional regulator [Rhizobium sp. BK313]|jgi:DNA-binding GntR family transcriptional regulator|uniref:GntR family transcriptional regulator n=1 Tax=Rhizobium sp. BK313 TaxID=2587081 RepID=UPI00105DCCEF|nr:GntR family transcriptional regulator [Rhizobium sp. BK313]MBB3454347.1 DNA-binding GntR family transcriptional regulator [Rhizobium sp. BK313]
MSLTPHPIDRRQNAAQQIHRQLRDWIITGQLKTGAILSEPRLADLFGISRTPIREAMKKLEEESLLDIFPQVGSMVAPIEIDIVRDSQFIRETLEVRTIELATENVTSSNIATLRGIIERQRVLVEAKDPHGFFVADDELHDTFMRIAGRPSVWSLLTTTNAHLNRVRYLSLEDLSWLRMVFEEHCDIVEAVAAHDVDRATHSMRDHLRSVLAAVERVAIAYPEYFKQENETAKSLS